MDVEHIREKLRGQRLPALARELDVPIPVLEMFITDRANLAPALLNGLARILARQQNKVAARPEIKPGTALKSQPAARPSPGNTVKLSARPLKCTLVLDPAELIALRDPATARVTLQIVVAGGRVVTADINSKSIRKARAAINEHGVDGVAAIIQGKLGADNAIGEAGLVVQVKLSRPVETMMTDNTGSIAS